MSVSVEFIVTVSDEQIALYKTNRAERNAFRERPKQQARKHGATAVVVRGPNANDVDWINLRKS